MDICTESFAEGARDECGGEKSCCSTLNKGVDALEVADAVRSTNGADHLWTAQERAKLRQEAKNDAKYPELILEFDAVCAWTSRDRVITQRMTAFLARERHNVLVEVKEVDNHILSPIDTEGIIGVLAWRTCDHESRRRCVAVEREKTTLVAYMEQCAMMRNRQEEEHQELLKVIKILKPKAGEALGHDGTKANFDPRGSRGSSEKDIPGYWRRGREDLWKRD